jgi:hypothetical protein
VREDFRPQWSDIDFVGMLERVPTGDDLAALAIDNRSNEAGAESASDQRVWYAPRDSNPEPAD